MKTNLCLSLFLQLTMFSYFRGMLCHRNSYHEISSDTCHSGICSAYDVSVEGECFHTQLHPKNNSISNNKPVFILQMHSTHISNIYDFLNMELAQKYGCDDCYIILSRNISVVPCHQTSVSFLVSDSKALCGIFTFDILDIKNKYDLCLATLHKWASLGAVKVFFVDALADCEQGEMRWDDNVTIWTKGMASDMDSGNLYVRSSITNNKIMYKLQDVPQIYDVNISLIDTNCFNILELLLTNNISYSFGVCWDPLLDCKHDLAITDNTMANGSESTLLVFDKNKTRRNLVCHIPVTAQQDIWTYISIIGSVSSVVCLFTMICLYTILPSLQTLPCKLTLHLSIALFFAQLMFPLSKLPVNFNILCKTAAIIQHFCWLCSFLWMSIYSVNLAIMFVRSSQFLSNENNKIPMFALITWGISALIVLSCVICDLYSFNVYGITPAFTCWIKTPEFLLFGFVIPIATLLAINCVCFGISIFMFIKLRLEAEELQSSYQKNDIIVCCKMAIIMGLAWILGVLANIDGLDFLNYPFIVINTFQGTLIFISFVCNFRIFSEIVAFYHEKSFSQSTFDTTSIELS